jgi:guanylate kinase
MLGALDMLQFSISATSRHPRANEIDGRDYHFLSPSAFRQKIENGDFLEWEEVYPGQFYGTLKSEVKRIWDAEKHVIFDLDVEGGAKLKAFFGETALALYIQAPSIEALEQRLRKRSTESEESLRMRLDKARYELTFRPRFDHTIVNDQLEIACEEAVLLVSQFLPG